MVERSNAWWQKATSLVPSLSDVHLPYLNGKYNELPGWAYMTIKPEGLTDQSVFANLLTTAAIRRGLPALDLKRMCTDPEANLSPLSSLVAEALHIGPNFYTYMRDYNNRCTKPEGSDAVEGRDGKEGSDASGRTVPVERFSASVRSVASGDCEVLPQRVPRTRQMFPSGECSAHRWVSHGP
jgi:hypothetical protein